MELMLSELQAVIIIRPVVPSSPLHTVIIIKYLFAYNTMTNNVESGVD